MIIGPDARRGVSGREGERFRGNVVFSSENELIIERPSKVPPYVIAMKIGARTKFVPRGRPLVGTEVIAECREERGNRFCQSAIVIPSVATEVIKEGKEETFRGEVVASGPKRLAITVIDEDSPEVIEIEVGTKTKFVPFRRPSIGEGVEVRCREDRGRRFGYFVKVISPAPKRDLGEWKTFRGRVVASSPKTLTLQVLGEESTRVIAVSVGLKTNFVPFRRPAVGEEVEVEVDTQAELGKRFCSSVRVIP